MHVVLDAEKTAYGYVHFSNAEEPKPKQRTRCIQALLLALAMLGVAFTTSRLQHWWDIRGGAWIFQHVLIVIDMQKDYDRNANMQLYGEILSPYVGDISSIVPAINKVRHSRRWDKVIFTQDWLNATALIAEKEHPFCVANTSGAEILDDLDAKPSTDFFYSKNLDDAFNIMANSVYCGASANASEPVHGYGLRNEGLQAGAPSNALVDILRFWGLHSENTSITIVGQMTDRCVMKTALHARSIGYRVAVERGAMYTPQEMPDPNWHLQPTTPLSHELLSEVILSDAAAGRELALEFLRSAGVEIRG